MFPDSSNAALRRLLTVVGAIAACLAIASAPWALDRPWLNFAFKPIATLCVIAWAALGRSDDGLVKRWIVIGLVFSLAGDVALLWPVQGFLVGLVAFLLGHAAYLVALTRRVKFLASAPAFGVWAIVAASVLARLWAGVPADLRAPVIVYVCALAGRAPQPTPGAGVSSRSAGRCSCCRTRSSPPTSSWAASPCRPSGIFPSTGSVNGSSPAQPSAPGRPHELANEQRRPRDAGPQLPQPQRARDPQAPRRPAQRRRTGDGAGRAAAPRRGRRRARHDLRHRLCADERDRNRIGGERSRAGRPGGRWRRRRAPVAPHLAGRRRAGAGRRGRARVGGAREADPAVGWPGRSAERPTGVARQRAQACERQRRSEPPPPRNSLTCP